MTDPDQKQTEQSSYDIARAWVAQCEPNSRREQSIQLDGVGTVTVSVDRRALPGSANVENNPGVCVDDRMRVGDVT